MSPRPAPAVEIYLSPTSVQGVQVRPVRPAQPCQHTMKNQENKLPLFPLGDIHITKRAEAELTARAVTSAKPPERYGSGD